MDFCEELQKPSIQCQLAKPNEKLTYRYEAESPEVVEGRQRNSGQVQ